MKISTHKIGSKNGRKKVVKIDGNKRQETKGTQKKFATGVKRLISKFILTKIGMLTKNASIDVLTKFLKYFFSFTKPKIKLSKKLSLKPVW